MSMNNDRYTTSRIQRSTEWDLQDAEVVLKINSDAQAKLAANEIKEGKDVLGLADTKIWLTKNINPCLFVHKIEPTLTSRREFATNLVHCQLLVDNAILDGMGDISDEVRENAIQANGHYAERAIDRMLEEHVFDTDEMRSLKQHLSRLGLADTLGRNEPDEANPSDWSPTFGASPFRDKTIASPDDAEEKIGLWFTFRLKRTDDADVIDHAVPVSVVINSKELYVLLADFYMHLWADTITEAMYDVWDMWNGDAELRAKFQNMYCNFLVVATATYINSDCVVNIFRKYPTIEDQVDAFLTVFYHDMGDLIHTYLSEGHDIESAGGSMMDPDFEHLFDEEGEV